MKIHKDMSNGEIAELLRAVAASYQIENENKNKFRIIAYNRAADAIEHLGTEVKDVWDEGNLDDISGIGPSIAEHLDEIFTKGASKHFEKVLKGIPKAALTLMELESIGPKRAYRLSKELHLPEKNTLHTLKKHAVAGDIAKIEGFGEETQADILRSIEEFKNKPGKRLLLSEAERLAAPLVEWMKKSKNVSNVDPLGSLRRKAPTVGDIDISCASTKPGEVIDKFVNYPSKLRVINKGEKSASIMLAGNIRADVKVESPKTYGALLQHFTGSKHHNVALREYALKKGMSLSEHGIKIKGKLNPVYSEEKFYKILGMEWIPPELREGGDELNLAKSGELPKLIDLQDIRGDLQMHSSFDIETSHDIGESSMEELIEKANKLSYEYIAFTEHNPSQKGHNMNQIYNIIMKKKEKIFTLNEAVKMDMKSRVKKVFNSLEVDILPNGELPLNEKALNELDFALVSIHSSFKKSRKEMTDRVLRGLSHPKVKIFAHPTARLLNKREGVELDWEIIFEYCKKNRKWIEINADPSRLDLPDFLVKDAVKYGVLLTLGTDAHHKDGLNNMKYGVSNARRGWATKSDIINTRSLSEFEKLLK